MTLVEETEEGGFSLLTGGRTRPAVDSAYEWKVTMEKVDVAGYFRHEDTTVVVSTILGNPVFMGGLKLLDFESKFHFSPIFGYQCAVVLLINQLEKHGIGP